MSQSVSPVSRARVYLRLGRISNLPTVWTNVLAGVALAPPRVPGAPMRPASVALLALAMSLFYVGGMFLNDAFDRKIDARERPERPIPAGHVTAGEVFAAGYAFLAAGLALVALHTRLYGGGEAPVVSAALLGGAILLYDAWHKRNPVSPLLMALCRVLVYVTAAIATSGRLGLPVLGGALSLLFYLVGLTAIAKQENLRSARSLAALGFMAVPLIYTAGAAVTGVAGLAAYAALVACVAYAVRILRGDSKDRIPRAVVTLIAGISLLDAALLAGRGAPVAAALAMLAFPLTLGLQRYVRGT